MIEHVLTFHSLMLSSWARRTIFESFSFCSSWSSFRSLFTGPRAIVSPPLFLHINEAHNTTPSRGCRKAGQRISCVIPSWRSSECVITPRARRLQLLCPFLALLGHGPVLHHHPSSWLALHDGVTPSPTPSRTPSASLLSRLLRPHRSTSRSRLSTMPVDITLGIGRPFRLSHHAPLPPSPPSFTSSPLHIISAAASPLPAYV